MKANAHGKVIAIEEGGIIAILETKRGKAYLDINTDFPLRLKIGDKVSVEDCDYYFSDGILIHLVNEDTVLNIDDWIVNFKNGGRII